MIWKIQFEQMLKIQCQKNFLMKEGKQFNLDPTPK